MSDITPEEAWRKFRKQQERLWEPYMRKEHTREFYEMLLDNPGARTTIREIKDELESEEMQRYKSLREEARVLIKRAHEDGELQFEEDKVGPRLVRPQIDSPEFPLITAAEERLYESIQIRERATSAREALSVFKRRGASHMEHWLEEECTRGPDSTTIRTAAGKQLKHLRTARSVLNNQSEITTQKAFENACKERDEPGGSVRKRVQRLGKEVLDVVHLPKHYSGFRGGFERLVEDLWNGSVTE
jgi:hypothetical protein